MLHPRPMACGCGKTKTELECGICKTALCKSCTQFLDADHFSFLKQIPQELTHTAYCADCFAAQVQAPLDSYNELMERAQNILVYEKTQSKETRLIKRTEKPVKVENCSDYQETILRLAFFAAQANYNAIIDVKVDSKKVLTGSYQSTIYSGTGVPANVQSNKIVRDRSIWQNPN